MSEKPMRRSIEPTFDSRETSERYRVSVFVGGRTVDWEKPIPDPFISTRVTVGWPDLLRGLLHRRLVVRVSVSAEPDLIEDVLELDGNYLGTLNSDRRSDFQKAILGSVLVDAELAEMADGDPRGSSPVHRLTVTLLEHREPDPAQPGQTRSAGQRPWYDLHHPADCDRLPYGQRCALDEHGDDRIGWPTDAGEYLISAWGSKSWTDMGWEYDAGVDWEPAPEPEQ